MYRQQQNRKRPSALLKCADRPALLLREVTLRRDLHSQRILSSSSPMRLRRHVVVVCWDPLSPADVTKVRRCCCALIRSPRMRQASTRTPAALSTAVVYQQPDSAPPCRPAGSRFTHHAICNLYLPGSTNYIYIYIYMHLMCLYYY